MRTAYSDVNFHLVSYSIEKIKRLRSKAEESLKKTAQLQQALAKIEATLLREENQREITKAIKHRKSCFKKFQTYNFYLRIMKNTYK